MIYAKVQKEAEDIMGGRVLEYEAKTIYKNGVLKTVLSMLKKGRITESEAAEEAGMSLAEFKKAVAAMGTI